MGKSAAALPKLCAKSYSQSKESLKSVEYGTLLLNQNKKLPCPSGTGSHCPADTGPVAAVLIAGWAGHLLPPGPYWFGYQKGQD